jgi:hypothetical protein
MPNATFQFAELDQKIRGAKSWSEIPGILAPYQNTIDLYVLAHKSLLDVLTERTDGRSVSVSPSLYINFNTAISLGSEYQNMAAAARMYDAAGFDIEKSSSRFLDLHKLGDSYTRIAWNQAFLLAHAAAFVSGDAQEIATKIQYIKEAREQSVPYAAALAKMLGPRAPELVGGAIAAEFGPSLGHNARDYIAAPKAPTAAGLITATLYETFARAPSQNWQALAAEAEKSANLGRRTIELYVNSTPMPKGVALPVDAPFIIPRELWDEYSSLTTDLEMKLMIRVGAAFLDHMGREYSGHAKDFACSHGAGLTALAIIPALEHIAVNNTTSSGFSGYQQLADFLFSFSLESARLLRGLHISADTVTDFLRPHLAPEIDLDRIHSAFRVAASSHAAGAQAMPPQGYKPN